ncbi:MAG: hypothetical protein JO344_01165 [Planctomycetaceae bacterium]|nr:hypothetical protein [Planctomycetaceae bacterium]
MTAAVSARLRNEALALLDKRGSILDVARELSQLMRQRGIPGVVIGGIAVVLHGHVRTTRDIDVFVEQSLQPFVELLVANGFALDSQKKEFVRDGVPIHLVTIDQLKQPPRKTVEIEGITTVSLEDLIEIKLRSGSSNVLRAQDLADAIGLIRHHRLTGEFARHLDKSLRPTYRRLIKEMKREARG